MPPGISGTNVTDVVQVPQDVQEWVRTVFATCNREVGRFEARKTMRKLRYLVRISKDPDSDWGASVPDLPGCVATGKTIDATLRRIQAAIELHLEGMREDGLPPPRPRQRTVGA